MDDGDDCLLIIEEDAEDSLLQLQQVFLTFGQELKLENRATSPEEVEFCQTKLVRVGSGPRMVRNWRKVLSQATSGHTKWGDPNLVRPMLRAVGECELALNAGVPILQTYSLALLRLAQGADKPKGFDDDSYRYVDLKYSREQTVTVGARLSFAKAWGIGLMDQIRIERMLSDWELPSVENVLVAAELDYCWELSVDPQFKIAVQYTNWPWGGDNPNGEHW
jgi:hypothetical protein